jgi:hypothetical protein
MRAHQQHPSVKMEPPTNFNAQMRELKRLRELVRKAQQSARKARKPAEKERRVSNERAASVGSCPLHVT